MNSLIISRKEQAVGGGWRQDTLMMRNAAKGHVGDRSILVFQIARCVARSVMRKTSDKGGDNRRSVPLGTRFIPYVQRGGEGA